MNQPAVIYARVSTDEQAEKGYSLPHQISECRRYAELNGFVVVDEFSDDYSGATLERPGFSSLRKFLNENQVGAVIVYTADRLSRNIVDFLVLREQWEKDRIELHYVDRGKSQNNFEGLLTDGIFALLAHGERLKIIERTTQGRHNKAKANHIVMSGIPPYGYRRTGRGREAKYEVDEFAAEVVRKIFSWYADGDDEHGHLTLRGISNLLDQLGVNPPSYRVKVASFWHPNSIRVILENPIYAGITYYGKLKTQNGKRSPRPREEWVPINVPELALISMDLFERAQRRAQRNREFARRNKKREYLLSGFFRCTACGCVMFGYVRPSMKNRVRSFYRCSSASHKGGKCTGLKKQISMSKADDAVWEWVASLLTDEENLNDGIRTMIEKRESEAGPMLERLNTVEDLICRADTKINRLVDELSQYDGIAVINVIREKIKSLENEREMLADEALKLSKKIKQNELSPHLERQIRHTASLIREKLPDTTIENKRNILEILEVEIQYHYEELRGDVLNASCTIPGTESQIVLSTLPRSWRSRSNSSIRRKRKSQ